MDTVLRFCTPIAPSFVIVDPMEDLPPILVVDYEPLVRLAIVETLKEGGYTVVEKAATGQTALEEISRAEELLEAWLPTSGQDWDPTAGKLLTEHERSLPRWP